MPKYKVELENGTICETSMQKESLGSNYQLTIPHPSWSGVWCTGTSNSEEAKKLIRQKVRDFFDHHPTRKELHNKLLDGIRKLSPPFLAQVKKALSRRIHDYQRSIVQNLMHEHELTKIEKSYVGVLLCARKEEEARRNTEAAKMLHTKLISGKKTKTKSSSVREAKCIAVAEQIEAIQRGDNAICPEPK